MDDYRDRVYKHYVHARQESLAPQTVESLKPRAPYFKKLIREHFPPDKNAVVLDIGCGHGALIYFARKYGYANVTGVDRSPQQVAEANRLGVQGVRLGNLMDMLKSLPEASLDVAVAFDVIEHFTKVELFPFVDEVYRVLRKGGRWIIHTPNGEWPFASRIRYGDFTHELCFTRESLMQLLKSSGFSEIAFFEDTPIPHGLKSTARWLMWKTIRGILRFYLAAETGAAKRDCIFTQNFLTLAFK